MKNKFLSLLCCPVCKSNFMNINNFLVCSKCNKKYPIIDDIPVLVTLNNLPVHLHNQIKYFDKENIKREHYFLSAWQKTYIERFSENFNNVFGKIILDCGTGSGYMAIELAKLGANVIATDLTLSNLIKLKKIKLNLKLKGSLFFVCCDAQNLPLNNESFDFFISNAVLEHLPNEKKAISEINRVCKKDSGLMITVPLKYKYLNPLFIPFNYIHDKRIGHLRRYDKKLLDKKFRKWSIYNIYYTGHFTKSIKTLINIFFKFFSEEDIERDDKKFCNSKLFATNLICFYRKK